MNGLKMSQLLNEYKNKCKDAEADTKILEPLGDWTLYIKKYTEAGKDIVEIRLEPPGDSTEG